MMWSLSASGTKAAAKERVLAQLNQAQPGVREAICALIDGAGGSHVSVSGAASSTAAGGTMHLSIATWTQEDKREALAA